VIASILLLCTAPAAAARPPGPAARVFGVAAARGDPLAEARALLREDRPAEALTLCETWIAEHPDDPRGWVEGAAVLGRMRRFPRAAEYLHKANDLAPDDPRTLFNLASSLQNQSLFDQAIVYWRRLHELADHDPELARRPDWIRLWGLAASELDRSPEALDAFGRLVALDPSNTTYRLDLAQELLHAARFEEAATELERVAQDRPGDPAVRYLHGWALLRIGRDEAAERELQAARDLDPSVPAPHLKLGTLYSRQRRYDEALASYREAVRLDPLSAEGWHALARLETLHGSPELADQARQRYEAARAVADERTERLRACTRRVTNDPTDVEAYAEAARLFLQAGDLVAAEPWLNRLLAHDPDNEQALLDLSVLLARRGELRPALLEAQKLLERDPRHPQANLQAARVLCALGRWKEAVPHLETAIENLPPQLREQAHALLQQARAEH
jgi:tetratricopeptide (TPR) repeat protein